MRAASSRRRSASRTCRASPLSRWGTAPCGRARLAGAGTQ
jgi:hypothetical protein